MSEKRVCILLKMTWFVCFTHNTNISSHLLTFVLKKVNLLKICYLLCLGNRRLKKHSFQMASTADAKTWHQMPTEDLDRTDYGLIRSKSLNRLFRLKRFVSHPVQVSQIRTLQFLSPVTEVSKQTKCNFELDSMPQHSCSDYKLENISTGQPPQK